MRYALVFVALIVVSSIAPARGAVADLNTQQAERYHALTQQLRCLVCQNQSIASSDAGLAADLRKQVARQISDGRSDEQIKRYLVDRYGQWVLYDPPFQWSTWLLWLGPFVLLVLGLILIAGLLRPRSGETRTETIAPDIDHDRLARVLSEYSNDDTNATRHTTSPREPDD